MNISYPPITPIPELAGWQQMLSAVAAKPLALCPDFPRIADRHERWWSGKLRRPLFLGAANGDPSRPILRRLELLDDPEGWLAAKLQDLRQKRYVGDALPTVRVDFGPVMLGGLLGGRVEFVSDTTWTHAFIDDQWSNAPDWRIRENEPWWKMLLDLLDITAEAAAGNFLLQTPDVGGSSDLLLNFRGSEALCLDAIEQPGRLRDALSAIYPSWRKTFVELYSAAARHRAGIVHWLGNWSSRPYMVPACDFNYMVGPQEFNDICLPDICRQAATVGRAVYHLDGPGAARHIDALLAAQEISAIQFTPGEGGPSCIPWVSMFRKIQSAGRPVLVYCPIDEVIPLARQIDPGMLAVIPTGGDEPQLAFVHKQLTDIFGKDEP